MESVSSIGKLQVHHFKFKKKKIINLFFTCIVPEISRTLATESSEDPTSSCNTTVSTEYKSELYFQPFV